MKRKLFPRYIGARTLKTVAAVVISMILVDAYGATTSKLIFAMLGAMAAVQPTFKESLESCLAQIIGVIFGALAGVLLLAFPISHLVATGIGIVLVITLYNALKVRFSPSLPCFIVVMLCTTPDIAPVSYALGRIWDTAIGLGIGMAINMLVFPYDNSRQVKDAVESLDREVLRFLEEMFDGDDVLPDAGKMFFKINTMEKQLRVFSNQRLITRLKWQRREIASFQICEQKARELLARMEILSHMGHPGRLDGDNRRSLQASGAVIQDQRPLDSIMERDVVMNYHVRQILRLRRELLEALGHVS